MLCPAGREELKQRFEIACPALHCGCRDLRSKVVPKTVVAVLLFGNSVQCEKLHAIVAPAGRPGVANKFKPARERGKNPLLVRSISKSGSAKPISEFL